MNKNIWSLGLLRNGKVYPNKEAALAAYAQTTNDGVAKLVRYLEPVDGGSPIIRTLVGFYADAAEMKEAGGGQSSYTILDIDGISGDLDELKAAVAAINDIIGDGIDGTTLTAAINDINARLGEGFTSAHTVADALEELETALTIDLIESEDPGFAKVYTLKQGTNTIGVINIPLDLVVKSGSLVHGTWSGDTFIEDEEGQDLAIKLVIANKEETPIYINVKDLVDIYTAGDGITVENNKIAIKLDENGEPFLTVGEDGLKLDGVQAAIDKAIKDAELKAGDGISIAAKTVKAVAAKFSAPGIENPITVDTDGIKFSKVLDCGFYDDETVIANTAADIAAIDNPGETDVFVNNSAALNAMTASNVVYNNIEASDVVSNTQIYLKAANEIVVDNMEITGTKGSTNGRVNYSAPRIEISNLSIANGTTAYNVFEGDQTNANLTALTATNITVDNPSLAHNVFNVYKPANDCVINIKDGYFNLTVDNANVLRLANTANATGVTVNFENIDWTYENGLSFDNWNWAGLIIYQPYGNDAAWTSGDLTAMKTWKFNFKNCRYNGTKVTANNFSQHNEVFYLYLVKGLDTFADPVANGFDITFE